MSIPDNFSVSFQVLRDGKPAFLMPEEMVTWGRRVLGEAPLDAIPDEAALVAEAIRLHSVLVDRKWAGPGLSHPA